LIWLAVAPERLGDAAHEALSDEAERAISTISAQEIAYLVMRRRMELDRPVASWIADVLSAHEVRAVAPSLAIAVRGGSLDPTRRRAPPRGRSRAGDLVTTAGPAARSAYAATPRATSRASLSAV
jgi:PIN domain nuclease of toxin-antitoxin system